MLWIKTKFVLASLKSNVYFLKYQNLCINLLELVMRLDFVEFEYPKNFKNRLVKDRWYVNYKGEKYFLGNPFIGYNIGININKNGQLDIWFGNNLLDHFDLETRLLIPEKNDIFKKIKTRKMLSMS